MLVPAKDASCAACCSAGHAKNSCGDAPPRSGVTAAARASSSACHQKLSLSRLGNKIARQQLLSSMPMQTRHLSWQSRPPATAWLMAAWRWTARSTHRRRSHTATAGADALPPLTPSAPLCSTPADLRCEHRTLYTNQLADAPQLSQIFVDSMNIHAAGNEEDSSSNWHVQSPTRASVRGDHEACACQAQLVRQLPPTAVHPRPPQTFHALDTRTAQQQAEQLRGWCRRLCKHEQGWSCMQRWGAQHALHACQVAQGYALRSLQNITVCSAF